MFGAGEFENENVFSLSFARSFLRALRSGRDSYAAGRWGILDELSQIVQEERNNFRLQRLFEYLSDICSISDKKIVLIIDEVDSAQNNQVFFDFLSQLRAYYIRRNTKQTFQSVILAGVYDVKNLKRKFCTEDGQKTNSPWNIAADFKIDMTLSKEGILGMLREYEDDYHTGMNLQEMAELLYDYTSGYPFLVSRLCKIMDEDICGRDPYASKGAAFTRQGFHEAVRTILTEKNTLFESLVGKLLNNPELDDMLQSLLFTGRSITYNPDEPAVDTAAMFGFIKNQNGNMIIANRIFEMRLYNRYLSTAELQKQKIYKDSLEDKNQFIVNGYLDMRRILEKFVEHYDELYHDSDVAFVEETGRKYFLLYLRPIINGTGNYYIESRTRSLGRTDVIVDYRGEQYIIEMKIYRGNEYNTRGERQLLGYLEDYHMNKGYMLSFNFNKNKEIGVHERVIGGKVLIEAVV